MRREMQSHYKKINRVLLIVLLLNWAVAAAKMIYGILSRCGSMTADGFHSLSDGTSNIIGMFGIHFACQPTDRDHPYGHKKYETFFSLGIAALLFLLCFELMKDAIKDFANPIIPQVTMRNFVVMLVTMAVNITVMLYERRQGKRLQSDILLSDAMHTKADIFTSLSVIAALIGVKLGFPIIDPIATILIAGLIGYTGFEIVKQSSHVLCDAAAILDVEKITEIVLGVPGVKACHKIRSRGRPDDIYIDLHVQIAPDTRMDAAHKISYVIEEAIKKGVPEVTDVVVHMEPK